MALKFNGKWRFAPPADGRFINTSIPQGAVDDCVELLLKVVTQGKRWRGLEHFKAYFCEAAGVTHVGSSSEDWAETDLRHYAQRAADNAPMFIDALYEACKSFPGKNTDFYAPDAGDINALLARHDIGYEIRSPDLVLREAAAPPVAVPERPPTLAENSVSLYQECLRRSEELLSQGRGRAAVQEVLFLLESVVTGFKGKPTASGNVAGTYFNEIVVDLRKKRNDPTLTCVLRWLEGIHGFLSSPTGGRVRHGLDLNEAVEISDHAARLFCNLVRSYLGFLLSEHEQLSKPQEEE